MVSHEIPFSVNVVHEDGSLLLALAGELDIATRPVLRDAVAGLLSSHLKAVTLDLANLGFVDVVGLRGLLDIKRMTAGVQADFFLKSTNDFTRRLIGVIDFDELEVSAEAHPLLEET